MNGKILAAIIVFVCAIAVVSFWQSARGDRRQWQLTEAAEAGDLVTVQELIAEGADVNRAPGDQKLIGQPALIAAAAKGRDNVVLYLLNHSASVNIQDSSGATALAAASSNGFKTTTDLLLAHGADPKSQVSPTPVPVVTGTGINVEELLKSAHAAPSP